MTPDRPEAEGPLGAVGLSWAAMLAYIWFRFRSLSYGTGAVVALVHDSFIAVDSRVIPGP